MPYKENPDYKKVKVRIKKSVWREFKDFCRNARLPMSPVIEVIIKEYLKKRKS